MRRQSRDFGGSMHAINRCQSVVPPEIKTLVKVSHLAVKCISVLFHLTSYLFFYFLPALSTTNWCTIKVKLLIFSYLVSLHHPRLIHDCFLMKKCFVPQTVDFVETCTHICLRCIIFVLLKESNKINVRLHITCFKFLPSPHKMWFLRVMTFP